MASEARAEPLHGTASQVKRWVLLEQPGAWGRDALGESRLPEAVARELRRRTSAAGIRIVLIRRGARLSSEKRRCYFARVDDRDPYLSCVTLATPEDLLDVDLSPLAGEGAIAGATQCPQPVFLVCTHGRHDACCAIRGNSVSRVACSVAGTDAWECSHIGGDRFAANLVCFPHGVYYGRVDAVEVETLMEGYIAGRISLEHYRGRCCHTFAVQAAEYFLRRERALTGIEDVALVETEGLGARNLTATFAVAGRGRAEVEVRVEQTARRYRLTCDAATAIPIPEFTLVACRGAAAEEI